MDFRFADFEINVARRELRRAGAIVHMEPQVFDLLVHLVRNRDRIVSKDELIDAIWQGRIISEAALSSRISAARRALGDSGNDQTSFAPCTSAGFASSAMSTTFRCRRRRPAVNGLRRRLGSQRRGRPSCPMPSPKGRALPLPDKPSIAVLPFQNMSHDPDQEYFADGLTEDIITGLSRQRWFFVIARNSSFTYKGQAVDVRDVAGQLGVRYVLEGSVRKAANRVRVTGQLIDAVNGNHLWADKYDRELADIFALQDDITNRVIGSVAPQILVAEVARVQRKPPQSIDAWDLVMQAVPHMWRMSVRRAWAGAGAAAAGDRAGSQLCPCARLVGMDLRHDVQSGHAHADRQFTDSALAAGARAVALDDEEPWGHLVLGLGHARRPASRARPRAPLESGGAEPQLCARPCGTRIWAGVRRPAGARPGGFGAGAQTQSARSVPGDLCAGRALYGSLRP